MYKRSPYPLPGPPGPSSSTRMTSIAAPRELKKMTKKKEKMVKLGLELQNKTEEKNNPNLTNSNEFGKSSLKGVKGTTVFFVNA